MASSPVALESTRTRLLDAAVEVFRERGYDGAGVHEIARRAGLTTGAIYANFRGKADLLFEAIGARSGDELDSLLAASRTKLTAAELLAELGTHLLDGDAGGGASSRGLLIEAFVAARRDDDVAILVRGLVDERLSAVGKIVDRAKADGSVDTDVTSDALTRFGIVLALGSLLYTSIGIDRPDEREWSALIHRIVRSLKEEAPSES
jgi:AcrR family transcriptional regulator